MLRNGRRNEGARGDKARGDKARGDQAKGDKARGDKARGDKARSNNVILVVHMKYILQIRILLSSVFRLPSSDFRQPTFAE
jgi:hypothetical protein